jgi:hypothetical protein
VLVLGLLVLTAAPLSLLTLNPATAEDRRRECAVAASVARWYLSGEAASYVPTSPWLGYAYDERLDCEAELQSSALRVGSRDEDLFSGGLKLSRVSFPRPGLAVVDCAHGPSGLGGHGTRVTLRQREGRWVVVAEQGTWIS